MLNDLMVRRHHVGSLLSDDLGTNKYLCTVLGLFCKSEIVSDKKLFNSLF